jgi:hypothetical protein
VPHNRRLPPETIENLPKQQTTQETPLFTEEASMSHKYPSFMRSMTSLIVLMLTIAVIAMWVINFLKTGEVLDIFNSAFSAFVGAYLQRSISANKEDTPPLQ